MVVHYICMCIYYIFLDRKTLPQFNIMMKEERNTVLLPNMERTKDISVMEALIYTCDRQYVESGFTQKHYIGRDHVSKNFLTSMKRGNRDS